MENQGQPSGSNFRPRSRMSTRLKAANGSIRKATNRFRSKRMNQIAKDVKKRQAYMPPNKRIRNDRRGISVANNAHMHGGKETYASDKKDQNGNLISTLAKKVPPTYSSSRSRQSLDMLPVNITSIPSVNGASKSKQSLPHILENIRHSPSSRLRDGPLIDIKLSDPSRAKDVLPSANLENTTPFLANDGSIAKLGHQMQSHHSHRVPNSMGMRDGVAGRRMEVEKLPERGGKPDHPRTPNGDDESESGFEGIVPESGDYESHFTQMREVHNLGIVRGPHHICSKVMIKSAHMAKHTDASNNDGDTLVLKLNDSSGHAQGQHINVRKSIDEISKPLNCNRVLKGSNISLASKHLVPNKYNSNEYMPTQDEVMEVKEIERQACVCEAHAIYEDNNKQEEIKKANRAPNSSSLVNFDKLTEEPVTGVEKPSSNLFVKDLSRYKGHKASCIEDKIYTLLSCKDVVRSKLELHEKDQLARYAGKINDVNSKRKMESLLAEKLETCGGDDSTRVAQWDNLALKTVKRRYIPSNEEDEDEAGGYNINLMGVDGTIELTPHTVISTDCIERQCGYCSKPIDKLAWSGIFKMDGKEYISLVGHLSTKSCEKVWNLSKSLPPMVEVERVSRSAVWTKIWKASKPTSDNIGMYFLPHNMRHDEELDQLVNEVKENDLVLRAVVNEAEMLIFPSILLPERYQTFQAKHYLWAVFKPREDKGVYSQNH